MSAPRFDTSDGAIYASWKETVEQLHAAQERCAQFLAALDAERATADALARELQAITTAVVDHGAVRLGDGVATHAATLLATFKAARAK